MLNVSNVCANCKKEYTAPPQAPASYGDILKVPEGAVQFSDQSREGLVTTSGVLPDDVRDQFSPWERVMLLANGNLQALVSAWFGAKVTIRVLKNDIVDKNADGSALFSRAVELHVDNKHGHFATAHSAVCVHDSSVVDAVASGAIGLGQLFGCLGAPRFTLHAVGRQDTATEGIWRLYELATPRVSARILEVFHPWVSREGQSGQ
ncbi:hypothetical protein DIPPA_05248 [Diplonema papillatum]|nr:hypothetical protein DIPPA_05248 [Diplonema papillatum]